MIGDGAGAVILRRQDKDEKCFGMEIVYTRMNSVGLGKKPGMFLPGGGSLRPFCQDALKEGLQYFKHDYREVLLHGPELYLRAIQDTFDANNIGFDDIDVYVPHQANGRVPYLASKMGVPEERVFFNFPKVGNTANASTLLCLDEIDRKNEVPTGGLVLLLGAESTKWLYSSILLRWSPLVGEQRSVVQKRSRSIFERMYRFIIFWLLLWFVRIKRLFM